MAADEDYITIVPAVAHHKFNVCLMKIDARGEYYAMRVSERLNETAAKALAESWAAATKLEIR